MTRARPQAPLFRWRVFGVATLLVGLTLLLVLLIGWQGLMTRELERLDDRLCMEGQRLVGLIDSRDDAHRWQRLSRDLALKLHIEDAANLRARVVGEAGGPLRLGSPAPWPVPEQAAWQAEPRQPGAPAQADDRGICRWTSAKSTGQRWRAVQVDRGTARAELAADLDALAPDLRADLRQALALMLPLGLGLALLSAWLLTGMAMRPLDRLREAMRSMSHRALDERLSEQGEDREFRELIAAYNAMLARLEASFHQASRFSADAAHELRTPLAILRGRLEQAITRSEGRAVQAELGLMQDEVARLVATTRKLLLLAQADAGKLPLQREPMDLSGTMQQLIADGQMLAPSLLIESQIEPGLVALADQGLMQQALNNLLINALRYVGQPAWLRVEARRRDDGVELIFANSCQPLDAQTRRGFFERFFRADPAHSRRVDGTGLGLSLVREIARAHGGDATLLPSGDHEVHLRLWLPG